MQAQRIFDLLEFHPAREAKEPWIHDWQADSSQTYTMEDIIFLSDQIIARPTIQQIGTGDIVVIFSDHSSGVELALEMAIMKRGGVVSPIHRYYRDDELENIFVQMQPSCIICQKNQHKKKLEAFSQVFSVLTFDDLMSESPADNIEPLPEVDPNQCALIMFTSGTTSEPKGVMLSHLNILSNVSGLSECIPLKKGDIVASYLPRSHVMERTATYAYLYRGAKLWFIPSVLDLQEAIRQIRPKWMTSVPLILERLYAHLLEAVEKGKWYERMFFRWSKKKGMAKFIALLMIGNAWKRSFAPGLRGIVVGGAALNPEIAAFFNGTGCRIREGYGLTETSPAVTFNRFPKSQNRFGTTGIPLSNVEVRIVDKNEHGVGQIQTRGPNVMLGYLNDDEATQQKTTRDGWFKTGDIGQFVDGRFLKITDRVSNVYKNASGRFVSPAQIEQRLLAQPAIEQAIVYGYNQPYNIAILIPNFLWLKTWANQNGIHWTDNAYMIHNPKIQELFDGILTHLNGEMKSHERIRKHILGADVWTMESGLLSTTLKPRRKEILKLFEKQVRETYEASIR